MNEVSYWSKSTALRAAEYIRGPQIWKVVPVRKAREDYRLWIFWKDNTETPCPACLLEWHVNNLRR